ncbi:MAG: flagellar basal body-associated FliL family protein [Bdellovibrionaceae bacterium]|nr:flagellar basal body-associated FliL family protein [Pseudobdellovibrionaceae bacterium]
MSESKTDDKDQASIELLEKSIQDNSPEFLQELESISEIGNENLDIELVDIDQIIAQQKANSLKARARRLWSALNQLAVKVFYFVKAQLITFGKETLPYLLKKLVAGLKSTAADLSKALGKIRTLSKIQKVALLVMIFGTGALFLVVFKATTTGLIKDDEKLFVRTMEELSTQKFIYENKDLEDFYNSPRVNQNMMSLRRIVVNIQKSKNSGVNPMGAFEFFIQGNSSDVMVEINDREAELLDLFQNHIREFSYDELDTVEGKRRMLEKLTRAINEELTKGKIMQIYFKNLVLKK